MYDKSLLIPCPVLRPTDEEFKDPISYLSRADNAQLGVEYGIVRVIPPSGWKPKFLLSPSFKFHTRLQKLSDLGLTTRSRKFFGDNINRFLKMRRKRPVKLFFKVSKVKVYYYDLYVAVDKYGGWENMDEGKWREINTKFGIDGHMEDVEHEYDSTVRSYAAYVSQNNLNYEFPKSDSEDEFENCLICGKHNQPSQTLLCDNCDNPYHMSCLDPVLDEIPRGTWYCDKCLIGTGEYGFEEDVDVKYSLPEFYNMCLEFEQKFIEDYNQGQPLTVDVIEQKFWEFVDLQKSDLEVKYGADIHNLRPGEISGFPMAGTEDPETAAYTTHPFNLTRLPFAKGSLLNYINTTISGMTIPWIYIGSLLLTFCWHVEDHYTLSANYCHFGATKKWYGIPSSQADQFEQLMRDYAPDLFQRQPDLLHQLVTLLSPMKLAENGIRCVYADQGPNEFVITYPKVYHSGFNCGFNFNEAVNFTMNNWLEFGEKSISEYKKIKKENVFNHYQLVENIMRGFNKQRGAITAADIDLVSRSVVSLETFNKNQTDLLETIIKSNKWKVDYNPKTYRPRKFEDEQQGHFEQAEEEEDLCDACKTYLTYQYCVVNNELHRFGEKPTRISIQQLLTPDSSPCEHHKPKFNEDVNTIRESEASKKLSNLNDKCVMAQYDELINAAKRAASEELDAESTRRKSRRLQPKKEPKLEPINLSIKKTHQPPTSKMSHVQHHSTMALLNQLVKIKLCLECCHKFYYTESPNPVPFGSVIRYETFPSNLKELVKETKRNLSELSC